MFSDPFKTVSCRSYPLVRRLLFALDPERAHDWTIRALAWFQKTGLGGSNHAPLGQASGAVEVMGLSFPNRLGLAAGLDKGAFCMDALGRLGFGHVEVGTLTPRAQSGNPKPRLFRLVSSDALINRMGFNNPGVTDALPRLSQRRYAGVVGVNIGKNVATPIHEAGSDYLEAFRAVYAHADYVAVNLSSPNTPNLRDLQLAELCRPLLRALIESRRELAQTHQKEVPIAVKIAPDLSGSQLDALADLFVEEGMGGIIATNTTLDRQGVKGVPHADEKGGLSGRPLAHRSTEVIGHLHQRLGGQLPIVGVGGIFSGEDALAKLQAGASLVQIYTGFVFRGPALIDEILKAIRASEKCNSAD